MKFGIFYEHQLPRPWNDGDEHRLFRRPRSGRAHGALGVDFTWESSIIFWRIFTPPPQFSRGVLATHQEDPSGHGICDAAEIQSPGAGRGTHRRSIVSNGRVNSAGRARLMGWRLQSALIRWKRRMWKKGIEQCTMMVMDYPG
jgi:hypothetical protein